MPITIEPATQRLLHRTLNESFPDAHISPSDVEALAAALHGRQAETPGIALPDKLQNLDLRACAAELESLLKSNTPEAADAEGVGKAARIKDDATRYYWVEGRHTRKHPSGFEPFVGKLAMARVTLPARNPRDFKTAIGSIIPSDHLIATVEEANDKYEKSLGYKIERLDVITPPRQGLRFGAISVMLAYRAGSTSPSAYILEAGTANGQPKVVFLGKTMDTKINQYSGYQPTPFACSTDAYTGTLSMNGDSPDELHITARKIVDGKSQEAYMDLTAKFAEEHGEHVRNIWPGLLIARAVVIVLSRHLKGIPNGCEQRSL